MTDLSRGCDLIAAASRERSARDIHVARRVRAQAVREQTSTKPEREAAEKRMPAYFYRLTAARQRTYLKSDSIERLPFVPDAGTFDSARNLMRALETGTRLAVNDATRILVADLCRRFAVPAVRIEVREVRPRNARGELHGIFFVRPPSIVLWMRTAQRHDVVKPRTFLRTLLHEVGHYLDYALLKLDDSFHTSGFFKRESFLVRALYPSERTPPASRRASDAQPPSLPWGVQS